MFAYIDPHGGRNLDPLGEATHEPFPSEELLGNPVVILSLSLLLIVAAIALLIIPFAWLDRRRRRELETIRRKKPRTRPFLKPSGTPRLEATTKLCPGCGAPKKRTLPWCSICARELATRAHQAERHATVRANADRVIASPIRPAGGGHGEPSGT